MKRHTLWMLVGCTVPLLFIFLLPILGVQSDVTLFVFIIAMFACHLMMIGGHGKDHEHKEKGIQHGTH